MLELERGGDRGLGNAEAIARILRMAHTLKGASRIVKQPAIADFAHEIEDIFAPYRDAPGTIAAEHVGRALKIFDTGVEDILRQKNLLTRDGRMKERKKYGLRGARRGTQFSKR